MDIDKKKRIFEKYDRTFYNKLYFDEQTGGFVVIHLQHSIYELEENTFFGLALAKHGYCIELLPLFNVENQKNPDAAINNIIADFKRPKKFTNLRSAIQNRIKSAGNQLVEIAVIGLEKNKTDKNELRRGLIGAFSKGWNHTIQQVWLLFDGNQLIILTREMIIRKQIEIPF